MMPLVQGARRTDGSPMKRSVLFPLPCVRHDVSMENYADLLAEVKTSCQSVP